MLGWLRIKFGEAKGYSLQIVSKRVLTADRASMFEAVCNVLELIYSLPEQYTSTMLGSKFLIYSLPEQYNTSTMLGSKFEHVSQSKFQCLNFKNLRKIVEEDDF